MAGAPPVASRGKRVLRAVVIALVSVAALDQLLRWTMLSRPAGAIGEMIELTGEREPPYFLMRRGLRTTYASWGRGELSEVRTSSLGYRDPERPVARPPGVRRVVATGDSITFGIGVDDGDAFPRQLERAIHARGHDDVEVWNAGVPGHAMADHLGVLRRRLLPLDPDLVVLQLSRNDDASPMPLDETFLASLRYSGLARAWMIIRFNFVSDAALFSSSYAAYLDTCERAGVPLLLVYEGLPEHARSEVLDTARRRGVRVLHIGGDEFPKLPDDPHFDRVGNQRVAEHLLDDVLALLDERR